MPDYNPDTFTRQPGPCTCTCQIAGSHDPDCAIWGPPEEPEDAAAPEEADHDDRCLSCGAEIGHYNGCIEDPDAMCLCHLCMDDQAVTTEAACPYHGSTGEPEPAALTEAQRPGPETLPPILTPVPTCTCLDPATFGHLLRGAGEPLFDLRPGETETPPQATTLGPSPSPPIVWAELCSSSPAWHPSPLLSVPARVALLAARSSRLRAAVFPGSASASPRQEQRFSAAPAWPGRHPSRADFPPTLGGGQRGTS